MNKITINESIHILEFPPTNKTILYKNKPTFINIPFYQQFVFNNYYKYTYINLLGSKNKFNKESNRDDDAYGILLPHIQLDGDICHGIDNLNCNNDSKRLDFINQFWMSNFSYYLLCTIECAYKQKLINSNNDKPIELYPIKLFKILNLKIKNFLPTN